MVCLMINQSSCNAKVNSLIQLVNMHLEVLRADLLRAQMIPLKKLENRKIKALFRLKMGCIYLILTDD